jgi:hypothetical protein
MQLDITKIPLSYFGSYYTLFHYPASEEYPDGLYTRTLHSSLWKDRICRWELRDLSGAALPLLYEATFSSIRLYGGDSSAELLFGGADSIQLRVRNGVLRACFYMPSSIVQLNEGAWDVNLPAQGNRLFVTGDVGAIHSFNKWDGDQYGESGVEWRAEEGRSADGAMELLGNTSVCTEQEFPLFEEALHRTETSITQWMVETGVSMDQADPYAATDRLAAYLMWSSFVKPRGYYARSAMFVSKVSMPGVWSWDHCFHGMALAKSHPDLAWDQWMLVFDHQDGFGALPDRITDTVLTRGYHKPPIHGWALLWMLEHTDKIGPDKLKDAYIPLSKWTSFWFLHRDSNQNGIPEYYNGNDSGWDNSTVFYEGTPVESPDLCAYLVIQLEVLSMIAGKLGKQAESESWKQQSEKLLQLMMEHFWDGRRFGARLASALPAQSFRLSTQSDSLLLYMPLLLGKRLPEAIRQAMIQDLSEEGRFLTEFGLASEALTSSRYEADGYWRGPIWAPPTVMLVHALRQLGESRLAGELSGKFMSMARTSGFPEHYDACTGEALRDPALLWTACAYHIFRQHNDET